MATTEHRPTERVLDILELLSNSEEGMTLTELAKALNAPKSTMFRDWIPSWHVSLLNAVMLFISC